LAPAVSLDQKQEVTLPLDLNMWAYPLKRSLRITLALLVMSAPCAAQQALASSVDRYVASEMRRQKIPGISLCISRHGRAIIRKSYGFANLEHQVPVKAETVFQSGSIGKQFAAAAVMILARDGKLSLDDKLTKFFPDAPATWEQITLRHLLTHTSGMGDYPPEIDLRRDYTEAQLLEYFKKAPLAFAPGTSWDYSNAGYVTLGLLIRKVSGQFYGDFLQERIFRPLGMTTARVISEADLVPNRAAGYRLVGGELKNQEWVSPSTNTTADGSLYFSILDLAKWDAALYHDKPLEQASLAEAWTPVRLSDGRRKAYGFGWHTEVVGKRRVIFHGGAWQGFKSFILRFPDDQLTIMFLANSWDMREFRFARGLAAMFYPEFALPALPHGNAPLAAQSPVQPTRAVGERQPKAISLVRRVLMQLARGNAAPDLFTPGFAAALFPQRAQQLAVSLNSFSLPVAIINTGELIDSRDENDLRLYRYLMTDITRTLLCTMKLTRDDKIASLELENLQP
jgi:CubicO group peptidase (beta-lactamase class C family)